jgi:hypothetical protein
MRWLARIVQMTIPLVVLYTIGYYIPGFSALTIPWIVLLTVLIFFANRLIRWAMGGVNNSLGRMVIDFLVATVVVFTVTLAIDGGNVPLGGAMLAAIIIAVLTELVNPQKGKIR